MRLTERLSEAGRRSGLDVAEVALDRAEVEYRDGRLNRIGLEAERERYQAALDRYYVVCRELREVTP
jgi:hypothetical protein